MDLNYGKNKMDIRMKEDYLIEKELMEFFSGYFTLSKIKADSDLERDLYLTGGDVEGFFKEYSKRFEVDISKIDLHEYFHTEDFEILVWINKFFWYKKIKRRLTIRDLNDALKSKVLIIQNH